MYDKDGKRKYRSTGKTTYNEALKYCRALQIKGLLFQATSYSFESFTEDFFDYEKCSYIRSRLLRGFSYGRTWAKRMRTVLEKILLPRFKETDIRTISSKIIDEFILELRRADTGTKTLNHILTAMKSIFGYAKSAGVIEINPAEGIKPFKTAVKEKGIFTRDELYRLFASPEDSGIWTSPAHFLLNYIAAVTGLRLGELLAIKPENLSATAIDVIHSWNRMEGLKGTKTGKNRTVPVSPQLGLALREYIEKNNITGFIFSVNGGESPFDHKAVYKHFWHALAQTGISAESRKERNISFHSYRHTFNTMLLEAGVHPETIRLVTGHTANMTARYAHLQLSNMPEIIEKITIAKTPALIEACL
jgi:integrase